MANKKDKKAKKAPNKAKPAKAAKPVRSAAPKTSKVAKKAAPKTKAQPVAKAVKPAPMAKPNPTAKTGAPTKPTSAAKPAPVKSPPPKPMPSKIAVNPREAVYERVGSSRIPTPTGPTNATVFPLSGKPGDGGATEVTIPKETRKKMFHIDDVTLGKIIAKLDEMRLESQDVVHQHVTNDLESQKEVSDVGDDLDQAVNERDREFDLIMHQRHLRRLQQVQDAFGRLKDGTYGFCEGTEEPINPKRLMIMPLARYSLEYQEQQEKMLGRSPEDNLGSEESFAAEE